MKKLILSILILGISTATFAQNVGIGSASFTPNSDALLEMRSTTSGFLLPKMTLAQKNAIVGPTEGLIVYQTDGAEGFKYFDGSVWTEFGGAADNFGTHIAEANIQLDDFWLSNDGDDEGIRVSNNGNVGIGVAIPTEKLHVEGNIRLANGGYIDDDNTAGGNSDDWIRLNGYVELKSASDNYGIVLRDKDNSEYFGMTQKNGWSYLSDNTTSSSYFLRGNGANAEVRGDLNVRGSDVYDNNGNIRISGEDDVYITMDYNNNDGDTRAIRFGKNSMGSPTELMRISESGNVGIGTSAPTRTLQIQTSNGGRLLLGKTFNAASGDVLGELQFDAGNGLSTVNASASIRGIAAIFHQGTAKGGHLAFLTKLDIANSNESAIERMRITHNGNVGIGTTGPTQKLDIDGNLRLRGLSGSGTEMMVVDNNGNVSSQTLPVGGLWSENGSHVYRSSGNVGIGTSSPSEKLHITGSGDVEMLIEADPTNTNDANHPKLKLSQDGGSVQGWFGFETEGANDNNLYISNDWVNNAGDVRFRTSATTRMTIDGSGNVGIGTLSPAAQLNTTGTVRHDNLAGTGTRMVVADADGDLSTQAIPSGGGGGGSGTGTTLTVVVSNHISNLNVSGVSFLYISGNRNKEIRGLVGGVAGQIIYVVNTDSNDKIKFKKNTGTQRFRENMDADKKEGRIIMYNGSNWYSMSDD